MKIGTLACRLFGHKFIGQKEELVKDNGILGIITQTHYQAIDYCIRCGIKREELNTAEGGKG